MLILCIYTEGFFWISNEKKKKEADLVWYLRTTAEDMLPKTLKLGSQISENLPQIKIFPGLVQKSTIVCLVFKNENK